MASSRKRSKTLRWHQNMGHIPVTRIAAMARCLKINATKITRVNLHLQIGVCKNRGGFTPKSSILRGFSIIFTIHFGGVSPYFWFNTQMKWAKFQLENPDLLSNLLTASSCLMIDLWDDKIWEKSEVFQWKSQLNVYTPWIFFTFK